MSNQDSNFDFLGKEKVENYEQKCLCVLVVDTSGSMETREPNPEGGGYTKRIDELNRGLQQFKAEIENDSTMSDRLEIAIVAFNDQVSISEPCLVENLNIPTLHASGGTYIGTALKEARQLVDNRKAWYKSSGQPYYRPWIILMTDGEPLDERSATTEAQSIAQGVQNKQYTFLPIGIGDGADMGFLQNIAAGLPAQKMKGLSFTAFFQWLSNSMGVITRSQPGESVGAQLAQGVDSWSVEA